MKHTSKNTIQTSQRRDTRQVFGVFAVCALVFVSFAFCTPHAEAAPREIKTVEYSFGSSAATTTTSAVPLFTYDTGNGATTSWRTVNPSSADQGFNFQLHGSNIVVKNAWVEYRAMTATTAASMSNVAMELSTCPGTVSSCASAPAYKSIASLGSPTTILQYVNSAEHNVFLVTADATAALANFTDAQWETGIETILRSTATGGFTGSQSAKLYITYEIDYETTAHTEVKTVRFPISATTTGDQGSRGTSLGAGTTQAYSYLADIPDLAADSDILDVYFEVSAQMSAAATNGSLTVGIVGGSTSPAFPTYTRLGDTLDSFTIYRPPVDSLNFQPNIAQHLLITPGTNALQAVGGELVVTYKYSTDAPVQTETVKYMVGQTSTSGNTSSSTFTISPVISNTGLSVKNIYVRANAANTAATNLSIRTDIDDSGGAAATTSTYAFVFTGGEQVGTNRVIHDMSRDAASFVSGGPILIQPKYSAAGGNPIALELFITFTWSGNEGGVQTKTVEYSTPYNNQGHTAVATGIFQTYPFALEFPETNTKTLRSAYFETVVVSSDVTGATGVNFNVNGPTTTSTGSGSLSHTNTGEGMTFRTLTGATTTVSIASSTQYLYFNAIADQTANFIPKAVVTYDVAYGIGTTTPNPREIKTIEYSFGSSAATTTTSAVPLFTYDTGDGATTSWRTVNPSSADQGYNFQLHGTNITVKSAWVEYRAMTATTAASMANVAMELSTCPGTVSSCASAPAYKSIASLGAPTTVLQYVNSGEHNVFLVTADATAAFSNFTDAQWETGIETILRSTATGGFTGSQSAKLYITYEIDYETTAHTEVKTVRFPISATTSADQGSRGTSLGAGTTQAYRYLADIPDLAADSDILDVYFEVSAQMSAASTNGSLTVGISGGSTSPAFQTYTRLGDTLDSFTIYRPPVNALNFQPNVAQHLLITPATNALQAVGGELVVTYKYSTDAPVQTETVKYMVGQTSTSGSTASSTFVISPVISNTGLSVKNLYVRANAANTAATNLSIRTDIDDTGGAAATTSTYAFVLTGGETVGTNRVIHDMSRDASSFVSGGPILIQSKYSAVGGNPVAMELFITFTWSGNEGGAQTKTVEYSTPYNNQGHTAVATGIFQTYPFALEFPEENTKTLRSAYFETVVVSSDITGATGVNFNVNGPTTTSTGSGSLSHTNTGEGMTFRTLTGATTTVSIASSTQYLYFNAIADQTANFIPKAVVTYDVAYAAISSGADILISGNLYEDEGVTLITSSKNLGVAIGTTTTSIYATSSLTSGAWNITIPSGHTISSSTPILVWLDGYGTTTSGAVFTKAASSTATISGLDLYQNRLIIRHEGVASATTTTLGDLGFYSSTNDSDIQFTATTTNGSSLVVAPYQKLYIWPSTSFTASGTVEVRGNSSSTSHMDGSLHLATSSMYKAVGTTTLAGSFTASTSATFDSATATLLFNATTTGKHINHTALTSFGTTTFNGSGGGWTFGTTSTTTELTITNGTVVLPSSNLTITGNFTNNGTLTHNSGTTTFNGGSVQTLSGTLTGSSALNHVTFFGSGAKFFSVNASSTNFIVQTGSGAVTAPSGYLTVSGLFRNSSTFTHNSGTTTFDGGTSQSLVGNLGGTSALNNVVMSGAGTKTFGDNASTSNFTILSSSGAVSAPTYFTIAGQYNNSGTFTGGSGTTTFIGTSAQVATGTMTGISAFNNLAITNSTASTTFGAPLTVSGHFAAVTPLSTIEFMSGGTTTLNTATFAGSSGNLIRLRSTTPGTQSYLDMNGAYGVTFLDVKDSNACPTGASVTDSNGTDSGNNTCWTITAAGITQRASAFLSDSGGGVGSTTLYTGSATSTPLTDVPQGVRLNLRIQIDNTTGTATTGPWRLQWENNTDSPGTWNDLTASGTGMRFTFSERGAIKARYGSVPLATSTKIISCSGGTVLQSGRFTALSGTSTPVTLEASGCAELSYMVDTSGATLGKTYRFRIVNGSSTALFDSYEHYPTLTMISDMSGVERYTKEARGGHATSSLSEVGSVHYENSIVIGIDGLPAFPYQDVSGGAYDVLFAKCHDIACTSRTVTSIETSGLLLGYNMSAAIGVDGFPVFMYGDGTNGYLKFVKCHTLDCSVNTIRVIDSSIGAVTDNSEKASLVIGADGLPLMTYTDLTNSDLEFAKCIDISCSSVTQRTLDATAASPRSAVMTGINGNPVVAYGDSLSELSLIQCGNTSCSSTSTVKVNAGVFVHYGLSMIMATDTNPIIVYFNFNVPELRYVRCYNPSCSSSVTTILETGVQAGRDGLEIALGPDGLPVIAYHEYTAVDLKYIKCLNDACTSRTTQILTETPDTGYAVSLALGVDGYAFMSHSNFDIVPNKTFKCSSVDCGPVASSSANMSATSSDLTVPLDATGYANVASSDDTYDTLYGATSTQIAYQLALVHTDDSSQFSLSWEGKLSVATTTYLQLWNRTNSRWETIASNTSPTPNTDFILATTTGNASPYYSDTFEIRARVVTATTTRSTLMSTDAFTFSVAGAASMSSLANQTFSVGYGTTSISQITIADQSSPTITSANNIRIKIATSTVHMRFDTTDTTASFGGTASGKVSGTVSYEGGGSVLVIDVTSNFAGSDTLTISGLSFAQFTATNTASIALGLYTDGASDIVANSSDDKTVTITGSFAVQNHTTGQVEDAFSTPSASDLEVLRFKVTPGTEETFTIANLVANLTGIDGIVTADLTNARLFQDNDADGTYSAGDTERGGGGTVSITGQTGTITWSTSFAGTTTRDFVVVLDTANMKSGDYMTARLTGTGITATGDLTLGTVPYTSAVSAVQHARGGGGSNGGNGSGGGIGGDAPAGQGQQGGGGEGGGGDIDTDTGGTSLGDSPGFEAPTANGSPQGSWATGGNGYNSDGSYATETSTNDRHTYSSFGFNVPGGNTITGIEVKIESSATTPAGEIEVALSWDGGGSITSYKSTGTLTSTDSIYELGGSSDTWGRSWTPGETADGLFTIEVRAQPNGGNTVRVDAIRVRIYHQASGGGGGGGGMVFVPREYLPQAVLTKLAFLGVDTRKFKGWYFVKS